MHMLGGLTMATTIKSKRVSYGTIELKDHGGQSPRYSIWVDGVIHEVSDDYDFMEKTFDSKYH